MSVTKWSNGSTGSFSFSLHSPFPSGLQLGRSVPPDVARSVFQCIRSFLVATREERLESGPLGHSLQRFSTTLKVLLWRTLPLTLHSKQGRAKVRDSPTRKCIFCLSTFPKFIISHQRGGNWNRCVCVIPGDIVLVAFPSQFCSCK